MSITISKDMTLYTTDGEKIGSVSQIVVDPLTDDVTHVVVRKGLLFTTDKVIDVHLIHPDSEGRPVVAAAADDIPDFTEEHFLALGDRREAPIAPPLAYFGAYATETPLSAGAYRTVVARNIPERAAAIEIGADVISRDGEMVGALQQLVLADSGQATHVVVDSPDDVTRAIPVTWIDTVEQDSLRLGVDAPVIERIGPFDADDLAA